MTADDTQFERLRAWKAEALPVIAGLQEVGRALGTPLGQQITARATVDLALDLRNQRDEARAEADRLRAENDALADHNSQLRHGMETAISDHAALRSAVAGVLGEWDADPDGRLSKGSAFARALRAILASGSAS